MTAISFVWNPQGGSTDFGTAGNWQPAGVPGPADSANFTTATASGTITGNGAVGGLQFGATTPWVLNGADLVYSGNVQVGTPDGNLMLTNGATLDGRSAQADQIGSAAGTSAAATVTGLGTTWKTLGSVIVDGGLAVSNQATMSAAAAITVGDTSQTSGALSVQGGANVSTAGLLIIGDGTGSSGAIQLLSGGTLGITGTVAGVELGVAAGAAGAIAVSGTDSALSTFGNQIAVGLSGAGALAIQNAGTVSTAGGPPGSGGGIALGAGNGGMGSAAVTGAGSELINVGQFTVGGSGTAQPGGLGALLIEAGGLVTTGLANGATTPAAIIAASPGSDGSSATVTGPASTWSIGGTLVVGDAAAGALAVSAGGTVSAGALQIGAQSAGAGHVAVSGATSSLALTGDLAVGGSGAANLAISNAATVIAGAAAVGVNAGGSGVIDLEGAGSTLRVTSNMTIGEAGTGAVILGAGSTLNVAGTLATSAFGRLVLLGGTVDPTVVLNASPTGPTGSILADQEIDNISTYFAQGNSISALGTLLLAAPLITNDHTVGSIGELLVQGFGDLVVDAGTIDNTQTVEFAGGPSYELLTIGSIAGFDALIGSFNPHAEIIVQGASIGSTGFDAGSGELTLFGGLGQSGAVIGTLDVSPAVFGPALAALETANADGGLGALPCFAQGTRLAAERGWVAVEALRVGDRVRTLLGGGLAPVVWVGWRRVACRRHPQPRAVWPVRVAAGAFGPGAPGREVWLSPDHAVFFEDAEAGGVLIPVKHLIDGGAIAQVAVEEVTYYHVELPCHEVVLAEGLAAESYLDTGDRAAFANGGAAVALYADFAALRWEAAGCAPLVVTGAVVERARAVVARRAAPAAA